MTLPATRAVDTSTPASGLTDTAGLPVLHFVHANSYPSATYRRFFCHLAAHYAVQALPLHAHDPRYPVTNGWPHLVQELLDDLTARYDRPVVLVGHSMGGLLALRAATARPDLVRCVVLLDSPVVAGWRALLLRVAKVAGLDRRFGPARFSEKRRNVWPDAAAAHAHYARKPLFSAWAPTVLDDYLEVGLAPHPEGVTLRFTREAETAVYRTLPHHLGRMVRRFPVPVGFIGGISSAECRQAGLAATRRLVGRQFKLVPGGHLFPMESPGVAADAVHHMIDGLLSGGA
ncbi:MAG: alpha/beta hydrolase [Herminiimonas sp.]|nr:alpha/beta hydrolase [Herminiimonas sp.]